MNRKVLDYLLYVATLDLNAYEYKILLLLIEKPLNQASLANILNSSRQYIYRCAKDLERKQLIEVDREEGRNKFYKIVTDINKIKDYLSSQTDLL